MAVLNHAFVPAHDRVASAQWFAGVFRVPYLGAQGGRPVARVRLNETLALDFVERERFEPLHLAFHVSDEEFDGILERLRGNGWPYGSGGGAISDGQVNTQRFGRNVYFRDPNGHSLELLTRAEWEEPQEPPQPPPQQVTPPRTLLHFQADQRWFTANRAWLLGLYEGKRIAIVDGAVVGVADDLPALAKRVWARYGKVPIYMPLVSHEPRIVRVPLRPTRRRGW